MAKSASPCRVRQQPPEVGGCWPDRADVRRGPCDAVKKAVVAGCGLCDSALGTLGAGEGEGDITAWWSGTSRKASRGSDGW